MPIEKRTFEKGMNQDLAESLLAPGMYRYALNIRNGNSEKGAVGIITNAEGNREISVSLPSGGNTVIGAYDDEANDRVIYIVYNTNGDNRIFAYNYKIGEVNTIISDSNNVLDLNPNYLITAVNVVDGNDTSYLLFTDNYGEPKNIDINQGIRTYDTLTSGGEFIYKKFFGDYDTASPASVKAGLVYSRDIDITDTSGSTQSITIFYRATVFTSQDPTSSTTQFTPNSDWEICPAGYIYGNHTEESFTNIVKPHLNQPVSNYTTTGSNYNFLEGNLFQFKVKYVRADGRESSWSPVTVFNAPDTQLDSIINIAAYDNARLLNNAIRIYIDSVDPSIYKSVKIAVRRSMNDTSPGDWQLAENLLLTDYDKYLYTDVSQMQYTYDGSNANMPLDTNDTTQLMSWIPRKAKTQSITSRNRVLYSNFVEGHPYTLDKEDDINSKPPTVIFKERDNPYNTIADTIDLYDWDGAAVGAAITDNNFLLSPIVANSGIAFRFPGTIKEGVQYSINFEATLQVSYNYVGFPSAIKSGIDIYNRSTQQNVIAQTTAVSTLLDSFVNSINNSEDLYINTIHTYANNFPYDDFLVSAQSANSGGSDYLIITPTSAVTYGAGAFVDTAESKIVRVPTTAVGINTRAKSSFKRGSQQKFAIAYSDKYGRITTAIENEGFSQYNPWWRDKSFDSLTGESRAGLNFEDIGNRYAEIALNHNAPSWATHYHILKTNSNGIRNHISFPLCRVSDLPRLTNGAANPLEDAYFYRGFLRREYRDIDSASTLSATSVDDMELIYIPLHSLQNTSIGYTQLNDSPLAYDYSSGDRLRLCYYLLSSGDHVPTSSAQYYESTADAEIVFYDNEINAIAIRPNDLPSDLVGATSIFAAANSAGSGGNPGQTAIRGLLCEIYSPVKEKVPEFYYEMYTGTISADTANSKYYHVGNIQSQNSAQAAIIELTNGDVFLKPRTYAWKATLTALSNTADTQVFNYIVEEANFFDKTASKTWGAGRPNRSIKSTSQEEDITGFLGEAKRPTTIRYSEPFLPDQGYNGLGTVYDLNFKDANGALKSIQHLHTEGSKTYVFHENAVGYAESDRAVTTTLDGSNITIGANTPVSDVVYYGTRAGIGTNPESFANNNYRKYFVDVDQGQVCRLSQDGVTPISETGGMNKYFKKVFREMINSPEAEYAYGAYDKRTDEYTLTLNWNTEVSGNSQTNVASTSAGALLTFTVGSTATYNIYNGQFIKVVIPQQESGGSFYVGIEDQFEVNSFTSTTVVFNVPTEYQSQINTFFGGIEGADFDAFFYPRQAQTLTYSEKLKAWTSFHSFAAENMCSAGLEFASFRAGKLYIHDDYDNPHSYYGTDFPAYIDMISNMGGDQVKIWKTMALKATTEDAEVDETDFVVAVSSADTSGAVEAITGGVEDSRGKISTGTTFVLKEGQLYSDYMRTGTGTTYSDFIEGDKVRGYWVYTRFKINSGISKIYKIISASFDFLMSNYTR